VDKVKFFRTTVLGAVVRLTPFVRTPMDAATAVLAVLACKVGTDNPHLFTAFAVAPRWSDLLHHGAETLERFEQLLVDLTERDPRYRFWRGAVNLTREGEEAFRACLWELDNLNCRVDTLMELGPLTGSLVQVALEEARTVDIALLGAFGPLAQVTSGLLDLEHGASVYDPTCGSADQLIALHRRDPSLQLYGQDSSLLALTLAQLNAHLNGVETLELAHGDTLAHPAFKTPEGLRQFDAVVCTPPMGLKVGAQIVAQLPDRFALGEPRTRGFEWAFVQDALFRTRAQGHTLVALTSGPLSRSGAEAELRRAALEKGLLEWVVALPARLLAPHARLQLYLLHFQKSAPRTQVLFVDATQNPMGNATPLKTTPTSVRDWVSMLVGSPEMNPAQARWVQVSEIERQGMSWLPEIYLRPEEQAPNLKALEAEVAELTESARNAKERFLKAMEGI